MQSRQYTLYCEKCKLDECEKVTSDCGLGGKEGGRMEEGGVTGDLYQDSCNSPSIDLQWLILLSITTLPVTFHNQLYHFTKCVFILSLNLFALSAFDPRFVKDRDMCYSFDLMKAFLRWFIIYSL